MAWAWEHWARVATMEMSKAANCFIGGVTTSGDMPYQVEKATRRYGKKHGGLWVGGRMHVRAGRIWFAANGMNRALHSNLDDQGLDLREVVSVEVRPAFLTKIIDVRTEQSNLTFRCFGAHAFARTVQDAVEQARSDVST